MSATKSPSTSAGATSAAVRCKGSLPRTVRAVAWSLIGLRKGSEYAQDVERLNPVHIIVVGLVAVFSLVLALIALVNWIV